MASILEMVQQQLGGGAVEQISRQIGADPGQTRSAIQLALPTLLGGLAHNTTQPGGAEALHSALDQHTGTLDGLSGLLGGDAPSATGAPAGASALGGLGGALGGALGGGGLADMIGGALGGKILGHVLGQRQPTAEAGISESTGLDRQQVGRLLMILAPIVLGVLARRKQQANLSPGQLGTELQRDQQQIQQQHGGGVLGGLLGQVFGA
jgi:hypothetical protein